MIEQTLKSAATMKTAALLLCTHYISIFLNTSALQTFPVVFFGSSSQIYTLFGIL